VDSGHVERTTDLGGGFALSREQERSKQISVEEASVSLKYLEINLGGAVGTNLEVQPANLDRRFHWPRVPYEYSTLVDNTSCESVPKLAARPRLTGVADRSQVGQKGLT